MKILFAANRFPYPPYRGDKLKIYNLALQLSQRHELHLLTFLENENDVEHLPLLKKIFKEIHLVKLSKTQSYTNCLKGIFSNKPLQICYFASAEMQQKVNELTQQHQFDVVHIQHIRMAQFWQHKTDVQRILDLPDAFSLYWKRRLEKQSGIKKLLNKIEYNRLLQYENVLNDFDKVLVCSKEDKEYLEQVQQIAKVDILPNGVDTEIFAGKPHNYSLNKTILFTGNMDYAPNVDAVLYFTKEIFPEIKKEIPKAKFVIAGQRPVKKVLDLATEDIDVTGFVKNLAEVYLSASIVVAPLRFGAGTQNKVLEAMSMGVPVVSHNIGFAGLNIHQGQGVFMMEDKHTFTVKCIELLMSENLRKSTGEAGKQIIVERYSWSVVAKTLEQYCIELSKK